MRLAPRLDQVWFQRAVDAKQENLRNFVDDMAAKGNSGTWAFSHDLITSTHQVQPNPKPMWLNSG